MLFQTLLPLFAFIVLANAYILPANLTDGIYFISIVDGTEVSEKIAEFPSPSELEVILKSNEALALANPVSSTSRIDRRQNYNEYFCGCGIGMDHGSCDQAVGALQGQLNNNGRKPIRGSYSFYTVRGSVIAFYCMESQAHVDNYTEDGGRNAAHLADITNRCGWYIAGTFHSFQWSSWGGNSYVDQGYMNWYPGLNVCGAAKGSSQHSC